MKKLLLFVLVAVLFSCSTPIKQKISCYAWIGAPEKITDAEIKSYTIELKNKGIDGLMFNGGHDPEVYKRFGKFAKEAGLEFHAWIPTMVQGANPKIDTTLYAVNGNGESAWEKQAYVEYYKFLCPNREKVYQFLEELYVTIAELPEIDGVHLDYIRYPDVILARGLWEKYGLVMDKEYPQFDYCYCDKCTEDFKTQSGIDIKSEKDPSQIEEWKQFRYDLITGIVNKLVKAIHAKDKKITAAVFPGPNSVAKKIVRQEWNKWDLDMYFPMNYNDFYLEDTKWIGKMCKEAITSVDSLKPVYSGLFICPNPANKANEKDPENHGLLPDELGDAIKESIKNGAAGICLFTPDRMTKEHWEAFESAIYVDYSKELAK